MKKLSLSILALLFAATSFAAPGWTEGVASKDVNAAVAADPSAIHRGGALIVDHATLQTQLLPWSDGDSITLDFDLPGELSGCGETPVGWECGVTGSTWRAGVADLDGVKGIGKLAGALDDFTAPGAQSYVRIPIAEVPSTGEWRIDKQLGGDWADFTYNLQPALTAQEIADGASRPAWAVNSIAIYHASKRNDINSPRGPPRNYMTGKAAHLPAPVAVGFRSNQTTITGWTYGAWEIDTGTGLLTKVFDAAVVQGWSAQTASVVADATLGYIADAATKGGGVGGNTYMYASPTNGGSGYIAPEDGTIESVSIRTFSALVSGSGNKMHLSAYKDVGGVDGMTKLGETSLPSGDADTVTGAGPYWNTKALTGSFSSGDSIIITYDPINNFPDMYYDVMIGDGGVHFTAHTADTAMPDPWTMGSLGTSINREYAAYTTYSTGGGGSATPSGKLGLDTSLSL